MWFRGTGVTGETERGKRGPAKSEWYHKRTIKSDTGGSVEDRSRRECECWTGQMARGKRERELINYR